MNSDRDSRAPDVISPGDNSSGSAALPPEGRRWKMGLMPLVGAGVLAVLVLGIVVVLFSGVIALDTSTGSQAAPAKPAAGSFDGSTGGGAASPAPRPRPAAGGAAAPAVGAPAGPPPTVKTYADWVYTCQTAAGATAASCAIVQQLSDTKSKATIFVWRIARGSDGALVSSWEMPTGVLVNRGMVLDAGTPQPIVVPYTACTSQHCEAIANLAPDFIATLSGTAKASATIFSVDGNGLSFPFSVNGLKDALAALQK